MDINSKNNPKFINIFDKAKNVSQTEKFINLCSSFVHLQKIYN